MQNEIHVHLGSQGWLATHFGPHAVEIFDLFGTTTVPTAFTSRAPLASVIETLKVKNPGAVVKLHNA